MMQLRMGLSLMASTCVMPSHASSQAKKCSAFVHSAASSWGAAADYGNTSCRDPSFAVKSKIPTPGGMV